MKRQEGSLTSQMGLLVLHFVKFVLFFADILGNAILSTHKERPLFIPLFRMAFRGTWVQHFRIHFFHNNIYLNKSLFCSFISSKRF